MIALAVVGGTFLYLLSSLGTGLVEAQQAQSDKVQEILAARRAGR
jgi:hypothetical protein